MIQDTGIQLPIDIHRLAYLTPYAVAIRYGEGDEGAMDPDEVCSIMDQILKYAPKMELNLI